MGSHVHDHSHPNKISLIYVALRAYNTEKCVAWKVSQWTSLATAILISQATLLWVILATDSIKTERVKPFIKAGNAILGSAGFIGKLAISYCIMVVVN